MAITANEISGATKYGTWPKRVKRCNDGWYGVRYFEVNTDDPLRALEANNLPRYGTPWVPDRNLFRCYDVEAVYKAGTADPSTDEGGLCICTAQYREPGDGRPLAYPGSAYTEIGTRLATIRQVYDLNRDPMLPPGQQGDLDLQIENGRGVTREYAFTTLTMRIFPNNQGSSAILQRQSLAASLVNLQIVNSENMFFPNIIGTGQPYLVFENTCRLHLQSHGIEAGYHFFDLEFLLGSSPAFFKWYTTDAKGNALRLISSQQYQIQDLANLITP